MDRLRHFGSPNDSLPARQRNRSVLRHTSCGAVPAAGTGIGNAELVERSLPEKSLVMASSPLSGRISGARRFQECGAGVD